MIRNLMVKDIPIIEGFKRDFEFPNLHSPLYILKETAINDDCKVVGAAFVKITSEGILILNQECSEYERAKAGLELIRSLKEEAIKKGLEDCHIWVGDPRTRNFARKLGFKDCRDPSMVIFK